jgi:hypothetical protein
MADNPATRRDLEASIAELENEHHTISTLLGRLGEAHDTGTLAAALHDLRRLLADHFAHEERPGGLYDRMGVVSEQYRDRVRALVDDHFTILSSVRTLEKQASENKPEIVEADRGLQALLARHETREHEMVSVAQRGKGGAAAH